jgi:hypothetical protein
MHENIDTLRTPIMGGEGEGIQQGSWLKQYATSHKAVDSISD